MFGSVGRSMLSTFTCFTEGCSSPDGTPFIWHLWDTRGPLLVIGYVLAFMFISFGVLNLILAVFVEVTLTNAKQHDAERQFGEQENSILKARQLHRLLHKLCKAYDNATDKPTHQISRKIRGLRKVFKNQFHNGERNVEPELMNPRHLQMKISQDQFEDIMNDSEVRDILDDLEISSISRQQMFDILDADGNGFLSISEVVDGMMKLRGPADKGDIVATGLCVRQLQKQILKIEERIQTQVKKIGTSVERLVDFTEEAPTGTVARI
mmetsp:Transcript_102017/g.180980  ORF Transcript_102017/g.180980 Transcript_102017/m.180980 type:complete len:266 (-) Transcript_102017:21-818(-)